MERHIIIKNKDDLKDNVKQLSDEELQEQIDNVWYIIQYTVGLNDGEDNNELCEYCSFRIDKPEATYGFCNYAFG